MAALDVWGPDPKNPKALVASSVEGQVIRVLYHLPSGHTVLEVQRNYEQALREAGLKLINESQGDRDTAYYTGTAVYNQNWETVKSYDWTPLGIYGMTQNAYITANGTVGGKAVTVAIWIGLYATPRDSRYENTVHFNPDQPVVLLDVVTAKDVGESDGVRQGRRHGRCSRQQSLH